MLAYLLGQFDVFLEVLVVTLSVILMFSSIFLFSSWNYYSFPRKAYQKWK